MGPGQRQETLVWGLPFPLVFLEGRVFVDREIESRHEEHELQNMYVLRSLFFFNALNFFIINV